jgi:glycosyltransferase involved in cell wall biosynthesis
MDASIARVIYLSSFEYPSMHAHPLHALSMARAFHGLLGDQFLFIVGKSKGPVLAGLPYRLALPLGFRFFKFLHLRTLFYCVWLIVFLATVPNWRENLIVFTNDLKLGAASRYAKRLFRFKLVVEVHGSAGRHADRAAMRSADRLVFVTQGLADRFLKEYPAGRERSSVVENAVDVEAFANGMAPGERARLGIPEEHFVIGYLGRFHPMESDKGIDFMIDALSALPEDTVLLLVGGTQTEIASARERAQDRGVEKRVVLVPFVPFETRAAYLLASDILAYVPPVEDRFLREETSPMKLYEYMAARRPIIASDMPAFRAVLDEQTAQLITPGSREEFVRAVSVVRTQPEVARIRVDRAYARVQ